MSYPWPSQSTVLPLTPGAVHLWLADLDAMRETLPALAAMLAPGEAARAARLRFPADADRWLAARATLRLLLGRYLDQAPAALQFDYGSYGKPELVGEKPPLRFSLAHSGTHALYGVTLDDALGVDLEQVRPLPDLDALVARFGLERERGEFAALPAADRLTAFFQWWTLKEAYLKATGLGLSGALEDVEVAVGRGQAVSVAGGWHIAGFTPAPGYWAALALARPPQSIEYWAWGG